MTSTRATCRVPVVLTLWFVLAAIVPTGWPAVVEISQRTVIQSNLEVIRHRLPAYQHQGGDIQTVRSPLQEFEEFMSQGEDQEALNKLAQVLTVMDRSSAADSVAAGRTSPSTEIAAPSGGVTPSVLASSAAIPAGHDIQYLVFQIFTFGPRPQGEIPPFNKTAVEKLVEDMLTAVGGLRGDATTRQLGFAVGPLALDHTEDDLRTTIRQSFEIAAAKNVAVVFHIDDSMFWMNQKALWQNAQNVEWSDWAGSPIQQRIIGWAPSVKLAPPMCYTSPAIRLQVGRIARDVIGKEIKAGIDTLRSYKKEHLFGGVIAGWETRLEDDRPPPKSIGYCALSHRGFSASNPPQDVDAELEKIVHDWARFWAKSLHEADIPTKRIYTHFPVTTTRVHAAPWAAFNDYSRPGFSVYGFTQNFSTIYQALATNGQVPWGNVEGTNINISSFTVGRPMRSVLPWEAYLGGSFQHGAALVNIFGWQDEHGVFGKAARSDEAIAAYKKFLRGEQLADLRVSEEEKFTPSRAEVLAAKVEMIHKELPRWLQTRGRRPEVERLAKQLEHYMKEEKSADAETVADQILGYMHAK